MKSSRIKQSPGDNEIYFLPLGGTGEIGMNLNLYGHAGKWLMVDLGLMFRDRTVKNLDVIMADPMFIAKRRKTLVGLVLTHAHEDHIGAIPYLWKYLRCPIFATPFTASIVFQKLKDVGLEMKAPITEVPLSSKFGVGPFAIELVTLTHSIPEPNAVVIRTKVGTIVHTGDWKLDKTPLVGAPPDINRLINIGEEGVLLTVCDSTNALVEGWSNSEADLQLSLSNIISSAKARVIVACFSSNIARLQTLALIAEANARSVVVVGKSLWRMYKTALGNGYLKSLPKFFTPRQARHLEPKNVLIICTGSQGEARAALPRITNFGYQGISIEEGDVVIFSSRIIPGNEEVIADLQTQLRKQGAQVITSENNLVHVSGHPARDELRQMYRWLRPEVVIPVHGENEHLDAHAKLARECGIQNVLKIANGDIVRLEAKTANVYDSVKTGRLYVKDGTLIKFNQ